ncbi:hypothetical protein Poli38472_007791 [Pythium oligandrum]|uniref:Alpha-tubulin N-acetyltransferase n=1 Tax=Pythium oligandrum TaxID=41045 RepID=A0A8K1CRW4_PYTOL|nr:hypothetical protein Poli38472_007791 [Pythium oligandrum]|eukprot:TMW68119.1 hypothetical protein Poli38472_007791 [Pythium oligandrum]
MECELLSIEDAATLLANEAFCAAVDEIGRLSAVAQALSHPITSTELFVKHAAAQQQRLYLALLHGKVVGFLKTGVKHLFYITRKGEYVEMDPLCVLDFYVHEDCQRHGIGLLLFQQLLQTTNESPSRFAYDRPSPKLIAFLKKHAQLVDFFPQPNNFVVFDAYFQ